MDMSSTHRGPVSIPCLDQDNLILFNTCPRKQLFRILIFASFNLIFFFAGELASTVPEVYVTWAIIWDRI
jgi:hypothetical protein